MSDVIQPPPRTITMDGTVPKRRIGNASEAVTVAKQCILDNRNRDAVLAEMKAMVDGKAPFSKEKLRSAGQGWRSNVNPMDAAAHLDAAMVPYYDLFATQRYRCEIETSEGGDVYASGYSRCITEEVDTYLRSDPCFESEMRSVIYWRVGYGVGTVVWRDPYSPSFSSIRPDKIKVPKLSLASVEKLGFAVIEVEYDVVDLYRRIEDEGSASEAGWNVDQVKRAIAEANSHNSLRFDPVTIGQLIKNNERSIQSQFRTVRCARVIAREFDGRVSESLVRIDNDPGIGEDTQEVDYLYDRFGKYSCMGEVISAFFQDSAEGYWHGATGQLQRIFNVVQLKMRQFNAIQDGAFLRAGPVVKASTPNGNEKAQIVQNGALTILPSSFEPQNSTIMGDLNSVLAVSNYNDGVVFSNTGVYRGRLDRQKGNPITATQATFEYENAQTLSNSAVNRFMSECDVFYKELVRRLLQVPLNKIRGDERKKVEELRNKIRDKGVPQAAIDNIYRVEASRGLGNGARWLQRIEWSDALIIFQMLSGRGAENFKEDLFASRYGYKLAKRWTGAALPTPSDERNLWEAQMETSLLKEGDNPVITDDQDNFIHAAEHLRVAGAGAQAIQSGADPVEILAFLHTVGPHVAEHLQRLATDKSRAKESKALTEKFIQLSKFTKQLEGLVQEQAQSQQQDQQAAQIEAGIDPQTRIAAARAKAEIGLKAQKQEVTLDLKKQKQEFDQKQRVKRAQFDAALADSKTAHGIVLKNVEAANEAATATADQT